ncbi:hypothetical protein EI693_00125 [Pseudomonas oryziphila]|uniref:Uncharacterized protein n=1 Tax=Pseudomonas oryziphila TaxID=2894079 RepID=A0ABM7CJL0_9PSED|nr:hypothetical protein EI693_00125 [Pseudomonas oryziphila]
MGAGLPAKKPPRCMAPAAPVFAGKPAPTGILSHSGLSDFSSQGCPFRIQRNILRTLSPVITFSLGTPATRLQTVAE